jgi:polyphenol oxidase
MIRKKNGGIEWLEFELFADIPHLIHGVFLRHGGASEGNYSSLNVLRGSRDDPKNVEENRRRICACLNVKGLISVRQIHGTQIKCVKKIKDEFFDYDGLISSEKNWGLLICHADCQAALFYDPIRRAIANVHAGWRGQANGIYQKTIAAMQGSFGSRPHDLLVCISPSLGPNNSEFKNFKTELPEKFWSFQIKPLYFDLWAVARAELEEAGILPHHLQIAEIDTYAHPEDFFSYRREKAAGHKEKITGGHGSIIAFADSHQ